MNDFVHLHAHTQYSLLDGMTRLEPLAAHIAAQNMPAVAITDHASMFGIVEFYDAVRQQGLKPIIGCEVYISGSPRQNKTKSALNQIYHLTLLAMNQTGFRNLNKLVSIGYLDGFYRHPRIDHDDLAQHHDGLICLSGCLSGEIPTLIASGKISQAEATLQKYLNIFGRDRFYLEIQRHGIPAEDIVTRQLVIWSKKYQLKLAAANDAHYLHQKDATIHDILLCIQMATSQDDPNRIKFFGNQFYYKTEAEMRQTFAELPQSLLTTREIADMCEVRLDCDTLHIPNFEVPYGHTRSSYLAHLCYAGLARRYEPVACPCDVCQPNPTAAKHPRQVNTETLERQESKTSRAIERLHYELTIIRQKQLEGYFLIVQDLVAFARAHDVPVGAGRGSAAGSLVSYLLGITEVDPLRYNLFFERFLNPERISMPDIDIDLGHRGRDQVFDYITRKYGRDHVAHIATLDTLSARTVIRDVGRSLGMNYQAVDKVAKAVPRSHWATTIDRALQDSEKLRYMLETDKSVHKLIGTARELEGLPRHASIHAAGVIITDEPLTHHVALQYAAKGEVIAQMTMHPVEKLGLLKMDLLGLRFITAVRDALDLIKVTRGVEMTEADIPLDDPATYEMLRQADTDGLFQVESQGMRRMLRQVQPTQIEDIMAVISLFKPGPMKSGLVDQFIDCKHGRRQPEYLHPRLENVLADTYGAVIYQEQVMQIAREIAGYSLGEADNLRRYMGKVQRNAMYQERDTFVNRAEQNGVDRPTAEKVFDMIQHFGGYGFNKAHAAGYAITVYHTAYMKGNYFLEYWVSLLNSYLGFTNLINRFVRIARRRGVEFLSPDVNTSEIGFSLAGPNHIRCGIGMIKHLGQAGISSILDERQRRGPIISLYDFCRRISSRAMSKKALESLIKAGAFGFTGLHRSQLLTIMPYIRDVAGQSSNGNGWSDQMELFQAAPIAKKDEDLVSIPDLAEVPLEQLLQFELESLEIYVSSHPLEIYEPEMIRRGVPSIAELQTAGEGRVRAFGLVTIDRYGKTRKGERMAYALLADLTGTAALVIFPDRLKKYHELLRQEQPVLVTGVLDHGDEEEPDAIIVDQMVALRGTSAQAPGI